MKNVKFILYCVLHLSIVQNVLGGRESKPTTSKQDCECIDVTMVCSFRDRTTFGSKDRCKGKTTHLLLNGNRIASLQANALSGLTQLDWIVLASNNLTTLPKDLLKETRNLQNLILSKNQIKSLPDGIFSNLGKLKRIDLSDNQLQRLHESTFSNMRSLKTIMLSKNVLTSLPEKVFSGVSHLEVLDLSQNQLASLPPRIFKDLTSLKYLILTSNRLTSIKGVDLIGLKSLESVRLDNNLLSVLPKFDSTWPAVQAAFYFSGNRITDVNESVLRSWLNSEEKSRILVLSTPDSNPLKNLESLRWITKDEKMKAIIGSVCQCGGIRKEKAEIRFCVSVRCGGSDQPKNWMEAVRAPNTNRL